MNPDTYDHLVAIQDDTVVQLLDTMSKNRKQPSSASCTSEEQGVSLRNNYDYRWENDAFGSSGDSCSPMFRGLAPFSESETATFKNFI